MKIIQFLALGLASSVLASCHTLSSEAVDPDMSAITAEAMKAEFLELAQRSFRTDPENSDAIILDRRAPAGQNYLEGDWIYVQLNTGPEAKLYRQNLSQISLSLKTGI